MAGEELIYLYYDARYGYAAHRETPDRSTIYGESPKKLAKKMRKIWRRNTIDDSFISIPPFNPILGKKRLNDLKPVSESELLKVRKALGFK